MSKLSIGALSPLNRERCSAAIEMLWIAFVCCIIIIYELFCQKWNTIQFTVLTICCKVDRISSVICERSRFFSLSFSLSLSLSLCTNFLFDKKSSFRKHSMALCLFSRLIFFQVQSNSKWELWKIIPNSNVYKNKTGQNLFKLVEWILASNYCIFYILIKWFNVLFHFV